MNFSEALHDLFNGFHVRRESWDTLDYVVKRDGYPDGIAINADTAKATGLDEGDLRIFAPYLMVCTGAARSFIMWTPNTADIFATDWRLCSHQPHFDNPAEVAGHTFREPTDKTPAG